MRQVSDIGWELDGTILVTFMEPSDIRCEGAVAVRQTVRIAVTDQYAAGIERVTDAARSLLADALGDWSQSDPVPDIQEAVSSTQTSPATVVPSDDDDDPVAARNWAAIEESRGD